MWEYWIQFFGYLILGFVLLKLSRLIKVRSVKNLYIDEGRETPVLYSNTYGLSAKPDAIIKDEYGRVAVVEYKSRKGKSVYDSDIVQAKCASLVARENNYPVEYILIKTQSVSKKITLPKSNKVLYQELAPFVNVVNRAREGKSVEPSPENFKCRFCSYKNACSYSVSE